MMIFEMLLSSLCWLGVLMLCVLAGIGVLAYLRGRKRAAVGASIACGFIVVLFTAYWLQGYFYANEPIKKQADSIAVLPPQAVIQSVDRGDWNDGVIVFTLPETKPVPDWMAVLWQKNALKAINLSENVVWVKTNKGMSRIIPKPGMTSRTALVWAGNPDAHGNSVTLSYDPKVKQYTYRSEANN